MQTSASDCRTISIYEPRARRLVMEIDLGASKSSFKWRLPDHGPSWTQTVGAISVSYFDETGIFSPSFVMSVCLAKLTYRVRPLRKCSYTNGLPDRLRHTRVSS